MLDLNHCKEDISFAFISAITTMTGHICARVSQDFGIDGEIRLINKNCRDSGHKLQFQLKSTSNIFIENGNIIYDLRAKNYNDIVASESAYPYLLFLYVLPENKDEWMCFNQFSYVFFKNAYWCDLSGLPITTNTGTVRIKIPIENHLNPESLEQLISDKVLMGRKI